jgi:hypothetical protein
MSDAYMVKKHELVFPDDDAAYRLTESGDAPGELLHFEFIREEELGHFWTLTPGQCEQLGRMLLGWRGVMSEEDREDG